VRSLTRLGLPEERTVSLMPGFDNEVFHVRNRDESIWSRIGAKVDPSSVKVLYVGRVSVEKNLPLLMMIWKRVVKQLGDQGTKAELIMVGDGPYREIMQRELAGMGVHFLGFRHGEELTALYATSDMFVFPSVTDTLGQVVMESQGSGLPVLVTDQGGPKEVVSDGKTGFVLSADDIDAWVQRVVQLVRDRDLRAQMSVAAHELMQTYSIRHSFEHFWDVHVHAWHEHLAKQGISPKGPEQIHRTRPRRDRPAPAQV
jgi:glycosyltransferase involved in cell wall biosynthesis